MSGWKSQIREARSWVAAAVSITILGLGVAKLPSMTGPSSLEKRGIGRTAKSISTRYVYLLVYYKFADLMFKVCYLP